MAARDQQNRRRDGEGWIGESRFRVAFARDATEVLEAQRLRWRVYRESLGADLPAGGIDADAFDRFCDHLLVRDSDTDAVVGTYRILTPERAREAGGYYSDAEFDLGRIVSHGARAPRWDVRASTRRTAPAA